MTLYKKTHRDSTFIEYDGEECFVEATMDDILNELHIKNGMTFEEYEQVALSLARYPNIGSNIVYPALGLSGESGEVADKVKKIFRDKGGVLTENDRESLAYEVGDVLWYVGAAAKELGYSLAEIARMNLEKLISRRDRGKLHGEGDDR